MGRLIQSLASQIASLEGSLARALRFRAEAFEAGRTRAYIFACAKVRELGARLRESVAHIDRLGHRRDGSPRTLRARMRTVLGAILPV